MDVVTGPIWQHLWPGHRVRRKRSRTTARIGEIVSVVDMTSDGVAKHVLVCWDDECREVTTHATDTLELVHVEGQGAMSPGTSRLPSGPDISPQQDSGALA